MPVVSPSWFLGSRGVVVAMTIAISIGTGHRQRRRRRLLLHFQFPTYYIVCAVPEEVTVLLWNYSWWCTLSREKHGSNAYRSMAGGWHEAIAHSKDMWCRLGGDYTRIHQKRDPPPTFHLILATKYVRQHDGNESKLFQVTPFAKSTLNVHWWVGGGGCHVSELSQKVPDFCPSSNIKPTTLSGGFRDYNVHLPPQAECTECPCCCCMGISPPYRAAKKSLNADRNTLRKHPSINVMGCYSKVGLDQTKIQ